MNLLVTGGAGYIGSHTCIELLNVQHNVVIIDSLCNSHPEVLQRINRITGKSVAFVQADIRDEVALRETIRKYNCKAVIHFAGLKAVGESVDRPLNYYENNVTGTLCVLRAMRAEGVKTLVFSSSATVYGVPQRLPLSEDHPLSAINPYGRTKLMVEDILRDLFTAEPDWRIAILRYFNPVGAHESGLIGENPQSIPNNLMPFIAQVAVGLRDKLNIWGDDYETPDGTGVRDYIHVTDLALGHLKALEYLKQPQCLAVNLGTGSGYSVLEMVRAFEQAGDCSVPYHIAPRRTGDVAACYADPSFAEKTLGWRAQKTLEAMCRDQWHWQIKNPTGYV